MDGHGTPYIGLVAMSPKIEQFKDMAKQARQDLFDQSHPDRPPLAGAVRHARRRHAGHDLAGRLALLLHLAERRRPQGAPVPPLHAGPVRHRLAAARPAHRPQPRGAPAHGRVSAIGQAVLCPLMAMHIHSLLLFPLAFLVLVCSEALPRDQGRAGPRDGGARRPRPEGEQAGYATLNARLTLLGTLAGFVVSVPGRDPLQARRLAGRARPGHVRLRRRRGGRRPAPGALGRARPSGCGPTRRTRCASTARPARRTTREQDLLRLQPIANPEVMLGLTRHVHRARPAPAS